MSELSLVNRLHRYACVNAGCAFLLLIAGGMVTSTGSALAVPDWPLAFGQYFPRMTGGVLFEHGHRMIAGVVGIMTIFLAVWTWMVEERRWVRWIAAAAGGGIVMQAALGGITVLYRLPPQISISHAVLGQTVFCLILAIAQVTSPRYLSAEPADSSVFGEILWPLLAIAAVYAQLILGALIRHTGHHILPHLLMAFVTAGIVMWAAVKTWLENGDKPLLAKPAGLLATLVPVQFFLGAGALMLRLNPSLNQGLWQAAIRTSHVAIGAAILGTCVALSLRVWRFS